MEPCLFLSWSQCFCVFIDFQNMPGAMRPAAPRPPTFSTMRPASQVPQGRMMSAQRVGQSSTHNHVSLQNFSCITASYVVMLMFLFCLLVLSHSGYGSSNSRCNSNTCAWSPSIQVCCRSPQSPTAHVCSATGHHAAGMIALFSARTSPSVRTSCAKRFVSELHSNITVKMNYVSPFSLLYMCRDRSL